MQKIIVCLNGDKFIDLFIWKEELFKDVKIWILT